MATKTEFKVRLENVELSKAATTALQKEINSVVAKHIAKGAAKGIYGSKLQLDPEWLGIWLRKFATAEELLKNKNYKKF
ncbi:hypothetical protein [Paraflavitalea sp. CAU 1676]|uniref:hypothetical protein n=1 Tax=Paraflavitalea sp. CAU 1676 TaxID=3032598 RepID=UPI0023DBFF55|nr:hypothetical protein [Paraflavitalea sp. CAU 1676]MDF2188787.1 hypothetical protein [Paraflavitalea sp. CAU 1676]